MNLAGLNHVGLAWAQVRNPQPLPAILFFSYRCERCDVTGYSPEPPHACWCCDNADRLVKR